MIPKIINGQWRIVHDPNSEWARTRGLANKPVNSRIYIDEADALAYLDKFNDCVNRF